jgi:hypothetical protein
MLTTKIAKLRTGKNVKKILFKFEISSMKIIGRYLKYQQFKVSYIHNSYNFLYVFLYCVNWSVIHGNHTNIFTPTYN